MGFAGVTQKMPQGEKTKRTDGRALRMAASHALLSYKMPGLSLKMATPLDKGEQEDEPLLELLYTASSKAGLDEASRKYGGRYRRLRSARYARGDLEQFADLVSLLQVVGEHEAQSETLPRIAASALVKLAAQHVDLDPLIDACAKVRETYPESLILTYLHAISLARSERFAEANTVVRVARASQGKNRARRDEFAKILRIIDAISRDLMAWSAKQHATGTVPVDEASEADDLPDDRLEPEILLQARMQDSYLAVCRRQFDEADSLRAKVVAIQSMMRQGLRKMPSYTDSYALAREAFSQLATTQLSAFCAATVRGQVSDMSLLAAISLLIQMQRLAMDLGFAREAHQLENSLVAILKSPIHKETLWTVADALVRINEERYVPLTKPLVRAARQPKKDFQIRSFLTWAFHARQDSLAKEFFNAATQSVRNSQHVYEYVRILQRRGNFSAALTLAENITATLFAVTGRFDPWRHWTLMRRTYELRFLKDTSYWFGKVPQPAYPKGVVMFAPRNAQQLTKFPLVVLMELKRKGWAVIPLIEGVMPRENTADPRINKFIGCITQDGEISTSVSKDFLPIDDLVADLPSGRFAWAGKDLSQVLWEEAAINRRRYHIDFTCPALNPFLDRLVNWTRVIGTALRTAHRDFGAMQLRAGTMVSFQARLPDVMVRFYCEERGDPNDFFCLHATNGYENYFANFSRSYSMKAGLRNMTANPELRTASFPIPTRFQQWYDERITCVDRNLQRVQSVEKVRRVARESLDPPEGALALKKELLRWKAEGGHVACLFGKVVCDLAAPTDGGPAHRDVKDWLNHSIACVKDSRTILLIKPHPHELRAEIATFLTEKLEDLIEQPLSENVRIIPADWFDVDDIAEIVDLGVIYNGTTAIELGRASVPAVLCSDFAPIDYPIGHAVPRDREHFRKMLRFEEVPQVATDMAQRAAAWITYMSSERLAVGYRYHYRPLTNKLTSPPHWFDEDIEQYLEFGDSRVSQLADRVLEQH